MIPRENEILVEKVEELLQKRTYPRELESLFASSLVDTKEMWELENIRFQFLGWMICWTSWMDQKSFQRLTFVVGTIK